MRRETKTLLITPLLAAMLSLTLWPSSLALALTAEEVLQLRQAGVSDDTIQQMLENERMKDQQKQADAPSAAMEQDKFANDHIGTWSNSDGRVVLSTGKADPQKDVFDPTVPNSNGGYGQNNVYPYVFPGAPVGPPAPVLGPHGPIGGGGMGPR